MIVIRFDTEGGNVDVLPEWLRDEFEYQRWLQKLHANKPNAVLERLLDDRDYENKKTQRTARRLGTR